MRINTVLKALALVFLIIGFLYIVIELPRDLTDSQIAKEMRNGCLTYNKRDFIYNDGHGINLWNLSEEDKVMMSSIIDCLNQSLNSTANEVKE